MEIALAMAKYVKVGALEWSLLVLHRKGAGWSSAWSSVCFRLFLGLFSACFRLFLGLFSACYWSAA